LQQLEAVMTTIVIDDEMVRRMLSIEPPFDLVDPQGRIVGRVTHFLEDAEKVRREMNIQPPEKTGE